MKIAAFIVFLLISFASSAFSISTSVSFARMNVPKTHYLVCVPKTLYSINEGYTAVFDTKTHRLKFKIDRYFRDQMVFLSDDGTELICVEKRTDLNYSHQLQFYSNAGASRTIFVFNGKSMCPDSCGTCFSMVRNCSQETGKISLYTGDSIYTVSYNLPELKVQASVSDQKHSFEGLETGLLQSDSIFGIARLKVGKKLFSEKLANDLKWKVASKADYLKRIFCRLTLHADGKMEIITLDGTKSWNEDSKDWEVDEKLEKKLIELIKSYRYSVNDLIPEGVPYWPFYGQLYFSEQIVKEK